MRAGMMRESFDDLVDRAWAGHFDCTAEEVRLPGTSLLVRERMRGSGEIHLTHLRARTFTELGPDLEAELADALGQSGWAGNLSAAALRQLLQARRLGANHRGLIFHLDPARLALRLSETPAHLRPLAGPDQPALLALCERCSPQEVDDAYVELGHEVVYGCFEAQQLVAAGSGYRRNGFLDIGVLTDPARRGRGLAPAIAAAISRDGVRNGLIAQYRCDVQNASSIRVAERAGFTRLFSYEVQEIRPG
jgi:hypothetical protein